jgi:hypothetical protein
MPVDTVADPATNWEPVMVLVRTFLPLLGSLVAVVVSLYAFKQTTRSKTLVAVQKHISDVYSEFKDFNKLRLNFPNHSHLFELPVHYELVRGVIVKSTASLNDTERATYLLQERALAIMIFSMYESLLYSFDIAAAERNAGRKKIIQDVINYLEISWLRNPRLLFFWCDDRQAVKVMFEPLTQEHFARKVLSSIQPATIDNVGPVAASKS